MTATGIDQSAADRERPAGLISLDELRNAVKHERIAVVMPAVPDMMGRLQGKRIAARHFLDRVDSGAAASEACAYILATDVDMAPLDRFELTGWKDGFQDIGVVADLDTIRVLPYLPGTALVHSDAVYRDNVAVEVAPRRMLQRQLDSLEELGLEVRVGLESEFVLCRGEEPVSNHNLDYSLNHPPAMADFFRDLEEVLQGSGTPAEAVKTEGAAGQIEVTFPYGPALAACDSYTVYKHATKHLAERRDMVATFMAAPFTGVGSGLHLHLSLWRDGEPAFATRAGEAAPETMLHAIGGLIAGLPHLGPLYAPHVNSYRRYATSHAFAPQRMNWGYDNRGCAVRVTGHGDGTHLEVRLPGADANPYLVVTAACAAIVHGLTHKLTPSEPTVGDPYADREAVPVHRDLTEALAHFERNDFAEDALGADLVRHYAHAAHAEVDFHRREVTDVDRRRGFDRA
ncbi:glutamine synthetase family protein [Streptomyces sp. NPDC058371]|uniref:glutamine synthetase family protein n=1 Tax=Streptomyces sp. NPDC058371 TaxID=3346463 RepID=UPI003669A2AE